MFPDIPELLHYYHIPRQIISNASAIAVDILYHQLVKIIHKTKYLKPIFGFDEVLNDYHNIANSHNLPKLPRLFGEPVGRICNEHFMEIKYLHGGGRLNYIKSCATVKRVKKCVSYLLYKTKHDVNPNSMNLILGRLRYGLRFYDARIWHAVLKMIPDPVGKTVLDMNPSLMNCSFAATLLGMSYTTPGRMYTWNSLSGADKAIGLKLVPKDSKCDVKLSMLRFSKLYNPELIMDTSIKYNLVLVDRIWRDAARELRKPVNEFVFRTRGTTKHVLMYVN